MLTWDELLRILRIHEVHLRDKDQKDNTTTINKNL